MMRVRSLVSGRVQGVGYRAAARAEAQRLGLAGWVRNLPDGRVELWAEGEAVQLERLLGWARRGPPGARVTEATAEWAEASGLGGDFQIRY